MAVKDGRGHRHQGSNREGEKCNLHVLHFFAFFSKLAKLHFFLHFFALNATSLLEVAFFFMVRSAEGIFFLSSLAHSDACFFFSLFQLL